MGIPMGMGWEWELKFYSHGNPAYNSIITESNSN